MKMFVVTIYPFPIEESFLLLSFILAILYNGCNFANLLKFFSYNQYGYILQNMLFNTITQVFFSLYKKMAEDFLCKVSPRIFTDGVYSRAKRMIKVLKIN